MYAQVEITAVHRLNKPVEVPTFAQKEAALRFSYQDYFFSFEFAALDFWAPSKNQYQYKMQGFDREWIDAGNRNFVTYTNLDPGDYTFHVRGSNQ